MWRESGSAASYALYPASMKSTLRTSCISCGVTADERKNNATAGASNINREGVATPVCARVFTTAKNRLFATPMSASLRRAVEFGAVAEVYSQLAQQPAALPSSTPCGERKRAPTPVNTQAEEKCTRANPHAQKCFFGSIVIRPKEILRHCKTFLTVGESPWRWPLRKTS